MKDLHDPSRTIFTTITPVLPVRAGSVWSVGYYLSLVARIGKTSSVITTHSSQFVINDRGTDEINRITSIHIYIFTHIILMTDFFALILQN